MKSLWKYSLTYQLDRATEYAPEEDTAIEIIKENVRI